jgi:acetyl-CoA decarbonylase/synthase complex subunit gamma
VERVGIEMKLDGFAIQNESGDAGKFLQCVEAVMAKSNLPLVLMSEDSAAMEQALSKAAAGKPLIHAATKDNWESMVELSKKHSCPLAVREISGLSELADLSEKVTQAGIEDIVLDAGITDLKSSVDVLTQIRRLALKQNFRPIGYPVITFPGEGAATGEEEAMIAAQHIAKYGSIIVLDHFTSGMAYPLLTLRLNIYTDPQKPIQMAAGMYEIGAPKPDSPLCVTTNFSLTYFSVAGEIEASGFPSWLLICDTEGLSVLTAWAAGKFDSERIAKAVKEFDVAGKLSHKSIILPGKVAVLRGEVEEELPDWKILIGPPEAMDIGGYLKKTWQT